MTFIRAMVWAVALWAIFVKPGEGQSALPIDRKQAKEEIQVIRSRIRDWGLPSEYNKIDDEKAFEDIILFIQDPVSRFDSIKYLDKHQLWNYIGMYDYVLKGSKGVGTFYFLEHLETLMVPMDDKKVKLVTYLMHDRQPDGAYAELTDELYAKLFEANPLLFVNELETRPDWKHVIGGLDDYDYEMIRRGLAELGESKFVKELKEYIAGCERRRG